MTHTWKVIYENGVFRPLEPVNLPERQEGTVTVSLIQVEQPRKSAYEVLKEMGAIGIIEDGPPDLSTNPKYMEGFGKNAPKDTD